MTMEDDKFVRAARRILHEAEQNLDAATLARLRAARRQALDQGRRARPGWLFPIGGLITAAVALAVAVLLWFGAMQPTALQASLGDLDLLTAREGPDFFADLDFYDWLEHNADAG
jgi:hypothetical protein